MTRTIGELGTEPHYVAVTLPDGAVAHGELALRGQDTQVTVHLDKRPRMGDLVGAEMHGHLGDGTSVSFLDCIPLSESRRHFEEGRGRHSVTFFPHYVSLASSHLPRATKLDSIAVIVEDAPEIFYDFGAFGLVPDAADCIGPVLTSAGIALGRELRAGSSPIVAYYTGEDRIVSCSTALGDVTASRWIREIPGGVRRVSIESDVATVVKLARPDVFGEALKSVGVVIRFLEVLAGRKQNVLKLMVLPEAAGPPSWTDVYWCMRPPGAVGMSGLSPPDLPLGGLTDRAVFGQVMANWVNADAARTDARIRYSGCMSKGRTYDADRLVAAANMFDILPPEALPKKAELASDLKDAVTEAKALFRKLPPGEERDGSWARWGGCRRTRSRRRCVTGAAWSGQGSAP